MSTLEERRFGAVVGALVADAAGKYYTVDTVTGHAETYRFMEFSAAHSHMYIIAYIYDGCLIVPYKMSTLHTLY